MRESPLASAVVASDLLVRFVDLAGSLALVLGSDDRGFDSARDFARALDLARDLALARDLDRAGDLDPARAGDLQRAADLARARAGDLDRVGYLARRDLADIATHAHGLALVLAEALGGSLGLEHVDGLADAVLNGDLDDFTEADLSSMDLANIHLRGVRWSKSGTHWPPGTDMEELLRNSEETPPESGVYVITPGGTDRARENVRI